MGAHTFSVVADGSTAQAAFAAAREAGELEFGRGAYSGSIASKDDFVMIAVPESFAPESVSRVEDYAAKLIDDGDRRIDDKFGPAGCVEIKAGTYLFFGWVAS